MHEIDAALTLLHGPHAEGVLGWRARLWARGLRRDHAVVMVAPAALPTVCALQVSMRGGSVGDPVDGTAGVSVS